LNPNQSRGRFGRLRDPQNGEGISRFGLNVPNTLLHQVTE